VRYFFADRRWVNPHQEDEVREMKAAWQKICEASIAWNGNCRFERLLQVTQTFSTEWETRMRLREQRAGRRWVDDDEPPTKRARRGSLASLTSVASGGSSPRSAQEQGSTGRHNCGNSGEQFATLLALLASAQGQADMQHHDALTPPTTWPPPQGEISQWSVHYWIY